MPSRNDARLLVVIAASLAIWASPLRAAHVQESAPAASERPSDAAIDAAVKRVKADPNLATERTIKTLQWRDSNAAKPAATPPWLAWTVGLIRWIEQSARALVWVVAVVLAAVLVVYISRIVRQHRGTLADDSFVAPTHVRDLDIRPETLPDDIGVAARALWDRGEHRTALALLYRGLLSRLAHVHRVPIRDSSTEGDCLALAASHLAQARHEYVSSLVLVWQRAVYGREDVQASTVYLLCDGFASSLDAGSPLDTAALGGTT